MSGLDSNAVWGQTPLCFRVTNINPTMKMVNIFNVNIGFGQTFDLMQLAGVTENTIKVSLLKGILRYKIERGDIHVECSDINLITYNTEVQAYLTAAGIYIGVVPDQAVLDFSLRYDIPLTGTQDGINRIFNTPEPFIYGQEGQHFFRPQIFHNGALKIGGIFNETTQVNGIKTNSIDYIVEKSSVLLDTNLYDQIRFISFSPVPHSRLLATYAAKPQ